ncbi:MAG TPA: filamentous hemagglutinin N-terminal domain-containing protein [Rhodocyclaceae bacterium]
MKPMRSVEAKLKFRPRGRLLAVAISSCFLGVVPSIGYANPETPTVVNGSATFSQVGKVLTVTNSNGAIINWNSFSIGAGETTYFLQSSASSSVLNRVLSSDPSVILGNLSSNGKVWLINSAGIMVGAGAKIDVAGFVASTLNISNANFLAGKLQFDATPGAGAVNNQGSITTPSGGSVYLIAPNVTNEGIITTPGGEIILAAGQTVSLIDTATPGVKVEVTGSEGNVSNLGTILADAGRIGMAGVLINNRGTLNASSVVNEGGRVFLRASQDAYVDGNGRIVTTGTKGGTVEVLGNRVAVLDNASIDASGINGGGTVLVGGDYQGKNPAIQNSLFTYFGSNASIKADATGNGNGGKVIVWADDTTRAFGNISARGGSLGGNGGFIETSGHNYLDVKGLRVDTRALLGATGTWLLDPTDITITAGSAGSASFPGDVFATSNANSSTLTDGDINNALTNTSITITTASSGAGSGDITIETGVAIHNLSPYGGGSLTLQADRNIVFGTGATGSISFLSNKNLALNLDAGGLIQTVANTTVNLQGGSEHLNVNILHGKSWDNYGTLNFTGNSQLHLWDGTSAATFNNKSSGTVSSNSSSGFFIYSENTNDSGVVNNSGTINVNASSAIEAAYNQTSTGLLNIADGQTLSMQNAGEVSGTVQTNGSGTLWVSEHHQGTGAIQFLNTTFNGTGTLKIDITQPQNYGAWGGSNSNNVVFTGVSAPTLNYIKLATNGGNLTLNHSSLISTGTMDVDLGTGNLLLQAANTDDHGVSKLQSQGLQSISANSITLYGGSAGNDNKASIVSYGGQAITATDSIALFGGASGHDNGADISNSSPLGNNQSISANRILLKAGGTGVNDYNDSALIYSLDDAQVITVTGSNGSITLYGGSGGDYATANGGSGVHSDSDCATAIGSSIYCYRSDNSAQLLHRTTNNAYGQNIYFASTGGRIALYGGSGGAGNSAKISNQSADGTTTPNNQTIGSDVTGNAMNPDIYLQGGSSGGKLLYGLDGSIYDIRNQASITSDSHMKIYGGNITMNGGGGVSGAFIGGGSISGDGWVEVIASGNVTMTGGNGGSVATVNDGTKTSALTSMVAIGSDKDVEVDLTVGGNLIMNSGSNEGGKVMIGSLENTARVYADVTGDVTLNAAHAGVGIGSHADPDKDESGGGTVHLTSGGSITLTASSSTQFGAMIGSNDDSGDVVDIVVKAGRDVVMNGGGGLGALIGVRTPTESGNRVEVTAGYSSAYDASGNIRMSNNAYIKAGENSFSGYVKLRANSQTNTRGTDGNIYLDKVIAGGEGSGSGYGNSSSSVYVYANGVIQDSNGSDVNVIARRIYFNSAFGGDGTGPALDLDVKTTGSLIADVGASCGELCSANQGSYGGVRLKNFGTTAPSTVTLVDYSTYNGDISFTNTSDLTNISAMTLISYGGNVTLSTAGDLTLGSLSNIQSGVGKTTTLHADGTITGAGANVTATDIDDNISALSLTAGQDIDLLADGSATVVKGSSVSLTASSGTVLLSGGSYVQATEGDLIVDANVVRLQSGSAGDLTGLYANGNLKITASNVFASNYAALYAGYDKDSDSFVNQDGNATVAVTENVELSDNVWVKTGNDVIFNMKGSASTLSLNKVTGLGAVQIVSDIATGVIGTTHLNFTNRSSGGVVIDGASTTTTLLGKSGFFAVNSSTPAGPGSGLDIAFPSVTSTTEKTNSNSVETTITTEINKTTTSSNLSDKTSATTELVLKSSGTTTSTSAAQTTGGDADSFGGNEKQDDKNKEKSSNTDTKEKGNGKSAPKNQCS